MTTTKADDRNTRGHLTLKEITDGTPDCACKFVPGLLNLQRCPLHANSQELLDAARALLASQNIQGCPQGMWSTADDENYRLRVRLETAIEKAGGR